MLNDILTLDQQWLPNQSDFPPISWPWYRLWPSPNYEWFHWSICNGCGMPAGNAYPSGHLVPSPILGLANAPIVETKFLEFAMSLLDFSSRIPLGTFSIFPSIITSSKYMVGLQIQTKSYTLYILFYLTSDSKVIWYGFGIEFLENKDIGIFVHFIVIDFIKRYSYHTYFSPMTTSWFRRFRTGCIVRNGDWRIYVNYSVFSALFPLKLRILVEEGIFCKLVQKDAVPLIFISNYLRWKTKRRRSDPVLWQKPLHQQKCQKGKWQHKQRHKKVRLNSDCGST